jgi:hypothetical protein
LLTAHAVAVRLELGRDVGDREGLAIVGRAQDRALAVVEVFGAGQHVQIGRVARVDRQRLDAHQTLVGVG